MIKLYRVLYGQPSTPKHLQEYQKDGKGPIGTISEWKKIFPNEKIIIVKSNLTPLQKEIRDMTTPRLLTVAQALKIESRSNSTYYFQRRYNMVLEELKKRGLIK